MEISKHAPIKESEDGSFAVPSQTSDGVSYTVKVIGQAWTCDCPDFVQRCDAIEACKHVFAVRFWIAARVELRNESKPKVFSEDATQCPKCGSIRVVRFGNYNGKQLYKCKDCRTKFREGLLKKSRYTPETIALTLDLYFSGMSLRKIARTLNDHFDLTMGATTVYDWIQRFVPQISVYVGSLTPQLSDSWHADELFVKMKGGVKDAQYKQNSMAYLWNVMDRKTRFLLASKLSKYRDEVGADRAFVEASLNAGRTMPARIYTDAHHAYRAAIKKWPLDKRPVHIPKMGVGKPHANNNRIERLNGTLRERVKVQRGWKSMGTQLAEGQRIHYNFVKPHQALNGQTPAEVAGIGIEAKDRWMALLEKAVSANGSG